VVASSCLWTNPSKIAGTSESGCERPSRGAPATGWSNPVWERHEEDSSSAILNATDQSPNQPHQGAQLECIEEWRNARDMDCTLLGAGSAPSLTHFADLQISPANWRGRGGNLQVESFASLKQRHLQHQRILQAEAEEYDQILQTRQQQQHADPFASLKMRYQQFQKEQAQRKADRQRLGEDDNDLLQGLWQFGQRLQGKIDGRRESQQDPSLTTGSHQRTQREKERQQDISRRAASASSRRPRRDDESDQGQQEFPCVTMMKTDVDKPTQLCFAGESDVVDRTLAAGEHLQGERGVCEKCCSEYTVRGQQHGTERSVGMYFGDEEDNDDGYGSDVAEVSNSSGEASEEQWDEAEFAHRLCHGVGSSTSTALAHAVVSTRGCPHPMNSSMVISTASSPQGATVHPVPHRIGCETRCREVSSIGESKSMHEQTPPIREPGVLLQNSGGTFGDEAFSVTLGTPEQKCLECPLPGWRIRQLEVQGWREVGRVSRLEADMGLAEDLPLLEQLCDEEASQVHELKREILRLQGLAEIPIRCWRAQFYAQGRLLCWLRGRNNIIPKAAVWAVECIDFLDKAPERARRFEASPTSHHDAREKHLLAGLFGTDRIGASVLYRKDGLIDVECLVKMTSLGFFCDGEEYDSLIFYDTLHKESLRIGKCLTNRVSVIDLTGSSLSRMVRNMAIFDKQLGRFPHREAPMPEGFRTILIRNTPAFFTRVWKLSKWMVTKRDQNRVHLFVASERGEAKYREELFKHVDANQVPRDFGGDCDCPWTFCGRSVVDSKVVSRDSNPVM